MWTPRCLILTVFWLWHTNLHAWRPLIFVEIYSRKSNYFKSCFCLFVTIKMEKRDDLYTYNMKIQIQLTLSLFRSILHCIWSSAGHLEVAIGQECNTCVLVCARRRPDTNMSCLTHQPEPPRLSGTNAAYVPLSTHCSTPLPPPLPPDHHLPTHPSFLLS